MSATLAAIVFLLGAWIGWRLCDRTRYRRMMRWLNSPEGQRRYGGPHT